MKNPDGAPQRSGHPDLVLWERYEEILAKIAKIDRQAEQHWQQLMQKLVEAEQEKKPTEPSAVDDQDLRGAAGQ